MIGNHGYAGATGCESLSDFAQVSDHGFQAFQTGQRSPVETAGIVPDRIARGDNVAPARLEIFLNYPLGVSSAGIAAFSHTK